MARKYKNAIVQELADWFLDTLELEAQHFVDEMLGAKDYRDRSGNLYDSVGYGIYLDGKIIRTNARNKEKKAVEPGKYWYGKRFWGHKLLLKAFSDGGYKPSVQKGYVVVFIAAMPYANVLQYGKQHGLSKDYWVIAFMHDILVTNFGKINFNFSLAKEVRDGNYQAWNNGAFIPSKFA